MKSYKLFSLMVLVAGLAIILAGCSATVVVENKEPNADFSYSKASDYAPTEVSFTSYASDPDGSVISHEWSFGDGGKSTGKNPVHTYGDDGDYAVTLTVRDDEGATDRRTENIEVLNPSPVTEFTVSPSVPLRRETVTFDAGGSFDPASKMQPQYIEEYYWSFGDGTSSYGQVVQKSYDTAGFYDVTLELRDDDGAISSVTRTVEVEAKPIADFTGKIVGYRNCNNLNSSKVKFNAPAAKVKPELELVACEIKVKFDAGDSKDPQGGITSYHWEFDDGSSESSSGPVVTHWFALREEPYDITLTVTDDFGLKDSLTRPMYFTTI